MTNARFYIGIDPDIEKSGYAVYDSKHQVITDLCVLSFTGLCKALVAFAPQHMENPVVVLEAGWLNKKANYRTTDKKRTAVREKIANRVGVNEGIGRAIQMFATDIALFQVILQRPHTSKLTHKQFVQITGVTQSTCQETRDAAMLVWGWKP